MKCSICILVGLLMFSSPAQCAMQALSNESLSRVKGSDTSGAEHDPVTEEPDTSDRKNKNTGNTQIAAPSSSNCRFKTLHESSEYKKFKFYLKKLEEFASEGDYPQLVKSDKFMFFCSCFAETAKKCREKLALLNDPADGDHIKPMLNEKNRIFCIADDYYTHLMRYKKGVAPLPDLNKLVNDIKKCQHNFESMHANINCNL